MALKHHWKPLLALALALPSIGLAPLASAQSTQPAQMSRLIIKFKDDPSPTARSGGEHISALNATGRLKTRNRHAVDLAYLKSVTAQTHVALTGQPLSRAELAGIVRQVAQDPRVEYAEIDEKAYPHFAPNDTYFSQQWALKAPTQEPGGANVQNAWSRTVGTTPVNGAGVVVAVLDTGYRPHADLLANVVGGYDFISADSPNVFTTANDGDGRDGDARDPGNWNTNATACAIENSSWHGTSVAGIIGAIGNNNAGVIGVAYGAKILPVRVLGVCGGYSSDIAAGMRWAAGLPVSGVPTNANIAKVINLSLGGSGACSNTYAQAVIDVRAAGSVVIVSTGNDAAQGSITQPANCAGVIAVTAHQRDGTRPSYANVGAGTTISAPGDRIITLSNTGTTVPAGDAYDPQGSGTSFAAPHVAGVAALLFQAKPNLTPDELQSRLTNSARAFPQGSYCAGVSICGAGLLDANTALALVQGDTAPYTTASADHASLVARGTTVRLTGVATPGSGSSATISTVLWTQVSGPTVTLVGSNTANASFVTPPGATDADTLVFKFTATSTGHLTSDSLVFVTLAPYVAPPPSGGGGGAVQWGELLALLVLALTGKLVRRRLAIAHPRQRQ